MKLHQIRDLLAVADKRSLRAAARHLGLAQPSLSRSIRELERELGVPLLERQTRGVVLTPVGEAFARRASMATSELRRAREEIDQLHGGVAGGVTFGASSVPLLALMPQALPAFRQRYPRVELSVIYGAFPAIAAGLKDGQIDFYIGVAPGKNPGPELRVETLFENTRVVVARRGHPLLGARKLAELTEAEWVSTAITDDAAEEILAVFRLYGLPAPRLGARTTGGVLGLTAVLQGSDMLAIVPKQWIEFAPLRDMLVPLKLTETLAAPPIVLVRRAALPLTPAAEHLSDLFRRASLSYAGEAPVARPKARGPRARNGATGRRKAR
jgi:LysR family transcriptional regulator of abg operon